MKSSQNFNSFFLQLTPFFRHVNGKGYDNIIA